MGKYQFVYILDQNAKYIDMCKKSIDTLFKFNDNVNVNIVSMKQHNLPYDNFVFSQLENIQLKHNKNDRITSTTYLKLLVCQLPYKKCIVIDPDTLIKGDLTHLFDQNIDYIACTQSHNYGKQQAMWLNRQKYFLSGFMFFNLDNLRKLNFHSNVLQHYKNMNKYNFKTWQHQETILNVQFYGLIQELDRKYNYCYNRSYDVSIAEEDVVVWHFPGNEKINMLSMYNKIMKMEMKK